MFLVLHNSKNLNCIGVLYFLTTRGGVMVFCFFLISERATKPEVQGVNFEEWSK